MESPKKQFQIRPPNHIVHFAPEHQQVFIDNDPQRMSENSRKRGFFSCVGTLMYNAAEKTILGKTKEKWLFILLGMLVASFFVFSIINLVHRTVQTSASEFTYTRRNGTGEYYVIRRKLNTNIPLTRL